MGRSGDRWRDGRRAVERIVRWYGDRGRPDADPLEALGDIGTARRLLDEAELEAVRSARRFGRSWAEIATRLGVSRQSAWERWRDLDATGAGAAADEAAAGRGALSVGERAAAEGLEATGPARAGRRRRTVPDVVGLTFLDARLRLAGHDLVGVHHDLAADLVGVPEATVTDQSPESGARVPRGTLVQLWTGRGGDAGVREPRRPPPTSLTGGKLVDDPQDEAVG